MENVVSTLANQNELILEAPPGAGKTTFVPLALLEQPWLTDKRIIMLQPRRMAARSAAERMAELIDETPGRRVGYQIRQESCVSEATRIIVMTEGILLRHIQEDPSLDDVGLIIFDEFHERSLDSDLSLALCLHGRENLREAPLKLLVMSATLQGIDIKSYLNDAPIITCEGRTFPVEICYRAPPQSSVVDYAAQVIIEALEVLKASVLVFLPGKREITQLSERLNELLTDEFLILPLYGSLDRAKQQQAIAPLDSNKPEKFKIVIATDIAETSLTIEGIKIVVDSGLARSPQYDPNSGLTRLKLQKISRASSTQRAGRAGRLSAGTCYRLWSQTEQNALQENYSAEILQADLAPALLQIYAWGVDDPDNLTWLDAPPEGHVNEGKSLLLSLDAIEKTRQGNYRITKHGLAMASLPTHPRLAHMIIRSISAGLLETACIAAALLSERDPINEPSVDFSLRIDMLLNKGGCSSKHKSWLRRVKREAEKFHALSLRLDQRKYQQVNRDDGLLLSFAYPDRIAKRINNDNKYKLSSGRIAGLNAEDPLSRSEWLVVINAGGRTNQRNDHIFSAVEFDPQLLEGELKHLLRNKQESYWDAKAGRFIGHRLSHLGAITYKKDPALNISKEQLAHAILDYVKGEGFKQLDWNDDLMQWLTRILFLREHDVAQSWPDFSEQNLRETVAIWLEPYLNDVKNNADLKALPLKEILKAELGWQQSERLEKLAPQKIKVPSGNEIVIDYRQSPPVLAVKLQEMFGCTETPSILNGKVPVMIHLLSPAQRPLQITQDIAGFWKNSYNAIKKEMKGRYPKHPWPDDPINATATRYTKGKKS